MFKRGTFHYTNAENQEGPFKPQVEELLVVDGFWGGAESVFFKGVASYPECIWITQMK